MFLIEIENVFADSISNTRKSLANLTFHKEVHVLNVTNNHLLSELSRVSTSSSVICTEECTIALWLLYKEDAFSYMTLDDS